MGRGKKYQPEQVVNLFRHIEVAVLSSSQRAESLGENQRFVRKVLAPIVQSKLVKPQLGKIGGVRLACPASQITLRDIYSVATADTKPWAIRTGIPNRCLVSSNVQGYFVGRQGQLHCVERSSGFKV